MLLGGSSPNQCLTSNGALLPPAVWFATRRGEVWVGLVASLRCWTQWLPHMGIEKRVRALRHYTFPLRLPLVQILRWVVIRPGTTPVITCTRYIESDGIRYSRCAGAQTSEANLVDASQATVSMAYLTRSPRPDTGQLNPGHNFRLCAALASRWFNPRSRRISTPLH